MKGFAERLLPYDDNSRYFDRPISRIGSLMPYHGHVVPTVVVDALNHMIDAMADGETVFNESYTDEEKRADPGKGRTGYSSSGESGTRRSRSSALVEASRTWALFMRGCRSLLRSAGKA